MAEVWRTSTYTGANGGNCVEVASSSGVLVRDTKDRGGFVLTVSADAWRTFIGSLKG